MNILIVEDDPLMRELLLVIVSSMSNDVALYEAENADAAWSLWRDNGFDLVLCDWEMPEMSGLELLGWLRANETEREESKTPFIMVTSRGDKSHVVKAVEAGVSDYIGKPFSNEQILKKVLKALSVNHQDLIRSILKGQSTMARPSGGGLGESASLLTSTQSPAKPTAAKPASDPGTSLLSGSKTETSKVVAAASKTATKVLVRSSKGQWKGAVRDLNMVEISVDILLEEVPAPILFEQVVIDLEVPGQTDSLARINGFVTQLELREASMDTRRVRLGVKFVDDDPEKMAVLSRLVAVIRR
jgi:DNA-binding response OmpR family regulator